MTFETSHKPTSSPVAVSGALPPVSPDGPTISPSGPAPARASRSRKPENKKGLMTIAISGRSGSDLSESVDRPLSPESKLQAQVRLHHPPRSEVSKTCKNCGIDKPLSMFCRASGTADQRYSRCRACQASNQKLNRVDPDKASALRASERKSHHKNRTTKRGFYLVKEAKKRAALKGIPFNLDAYRNEIQSRVSAGYCEMTGIPFNLATGKGHIWNSPSLDRIHPELGYVISNVRVVLFCLNVMMNAWGEAKLLEVVEALKKKRHVPEGPLHNFIPNLKARLNRIGSTEYSMTWKEKVTPFGRSVWQHVPSTPPTSETASIGSPWTTPCASETGNRQGKYPQGGTFLNTQMLHSHWPTPTVADVQGGRKTRSGKRSDEPLLNGLMTWNTPRASDGEKGTRSYEGTIREMARKNGKIDDLPCQIQLPAGGQPLPAQMHQATWPMPTKQDCSRGNGTIREHDTGIPLVQRMAATAAIGPTPNGSSATTEKRGAPNPVFACYLMGFSFQWMLSAARALQTFQKPKAIKLFSEKAVLNSGGSPEMPSSRSSRRKSSAPCLKPSQPIEFFGLWSLFRSNEVDKPGADGA